MKRPFLLGLTGSIGMGKSTTAQMFAEEGIPVWDADSAVHHLYGAGGMAVTAVAKLCPEAVVGGVVDRAKLKDWIVRDPAALDQIETIVHPLVAADRRAFVDGAAEAGADIVVLDVPLLFETGTDKMMDATVVVTVPADVQRDRVLARPDMTAAQFEVILRRQMADADKTARATHVIVTDTPERARAAVQALIREIRTNHA